jgi:iron complex outermembrane receptor protein
MNLKLLKEFLESILTTEFSSPGTKFSLSRYLLVFSVLISINLPLHAQAQENILQRNITLVSQSITVKEALDQISKNIGYNFSYNSSQLQLSKRLQPNYTKLPLQDVLRSILGKRLSGMQVNGSNIHLQTQLAEVILTGYVISSTGDSIPFATVALSKINRSLQTDANGKFRFNVPAGTYHLRASYIGYNLAEIDVNIQEGQTTRMNVILTATNNVLQNVEILGRKERSYRNKSAFTGTKTETLLKDVPQAISYVTKETIDDQMAFKVNDAIKNVSGVNQSTYNNRDFVIRGFDAASKLINGLRVVTEIRSQTVLPNIERIEVIKGPASALFANTSPGGTINLVTKKPLDEARKSINIGIGSFNTFRAAADFTGPMNENKTLLFRLNLAYQDAESFRILQGGKTMVIAPSFSFIPNDKTSVNVDIVYQDNKTRFDRGQPIFGGSQGTDLYSTEISQAVGKRNDHHDELFMTATMSLQHKFNDNIAFNTSYMRSLYDEDLLEHRGANAYGVDANGDELRDMIAMQAITRLFKTYTANLTSYFTSNFKTGPIKHKLLVGYDHIDNVFNDDNSTIRARGYLSADGLTTYNSYDPERRDRYMIRDNMPVPNVPHLNLRNPDYGISEMYNYISAPVDEPGSQSYINGLYLQEQMTFGRFQALLGLRQEFYTDIINHGRADETKTRQDALIPRLGLVFTALKNLNLYATYTQGYLPQLAGTIGNPAIYGGPFDPLKSNMVEAGAKADLLDNRLSLTAALYQIVQNNILVTALDPVNADALRQIGQQRARGFELDLNGEVTRNLNVTANFSYNLARITESSEETEIGRLMPNAPKSQGGFWAKYLFKETKLKDLGIAFGANYATERNTNTVGLQLPAYWLASGALYYQVDKFKISLNANNLFDKTYWIGGSDYTRLYPGTPRNYMIGLAYSF